MAKQNARKSYRAKRDFRKTTESDARRNPVSTQPQSVLSGKTLKDIAREANKSATHKQEKAR